MTNKQITALALRFLFSNIKTVEEMIERKIDEKQLQKLIQNYEEEKKKSTPQQKDLK